METITHARTQVVNRHVVNQPILCSSVRPTHAGSAALRGLIKRILGAVTLAAAVAAPAWSAQRPDVPPGQRAERTVDPEAAAHAQWKEAMKQYPKPSGGCFHASYPNIAWGKVECSRGVPRAHPVHVERSSDEPEVVGIGNDYVAFAKGLINSASGYLIQKGATSEQSVGVAIFGNGGILGPNEYSLQLNTNDGESTSACAGHSG